MQAQKSASEADLVQYVRRAAQSDVSSRSRGSRGSRLSRKASSHGSLASSSGSRLIGMTLQDMQAHVQNAAMERYMSELEKDTKKTMASNVQLRDSMQEGVDDEKEERRRQRQMCQRHQMELMEQIEQNKQKRANNRKDFIEAASSHEFPLFTETFISQEAVDKARHDQKMQFREDLTEQMMVSTLLRNVEKKKVEDHAKLKAKNGMALMREERAAEQEKCRQQGKELRDAWDRDVKLKSVKKALQCTRVREEAA